MNSISVQQLSYSCNDFSLVNTRKNFTSNDNHSFRDRKHSGRKRIKTQIKFEYYNRNLDDLSENSKMKK